MKKTKGKKTVFSNRLIALLLTLLTALQAAPSELSIIASRADLGRNAVQSESPAAEGGYRLTDVYGSVVKAIIA